MLSDGETAVCGASSEDTVDVKPIAEPTKPTSGHGGWVFTVGDNARPCPQSGASPVFVGLWPDGAERGDRALLVEPGEAAPMVMNLGRSAPMEWDDGVWRHSCFLR